MFNTLIDKINYEYDRFYDYLVLMSRPDMVRRAYEIAVKKAIRDRLVEDFEADRLASETVCLMMNTEDLIDYLYMKLENHIVFKGQKITDESWTYCMSRIKF